ncbi:Uncharacterized protein SCF082_LOCUS10029 [Durusdinium trenchii]|uniref:Apple domain-containing protein n=1 Tax=Durusdinium trenchii TaxID=1381693 RepID=A0ABP0J377_9DINO
MYLVDNEDSQIVYLEDDSQFQHSAAPTTEKTTDPGCPCEMHWIEDYRSTDGEVMLPGVARFIPDDLIARRVCRENPDLERIISQQYAGNQAEIEAIISKTPSCTAVDYCAAGHSDHYPKWCYVSARDLPDGEFKNLCSEYTWFWCNAAEQRPTAARWKLLPGATLLGNEKRFETIYLFELSGFELMRPQLSEDLWLTSKMPYDYSIDSSRAQQSGFFLAGTGILKGFVDTGSGQARCGEYCCGLPILREHNTSTGVSGFICLLRNLSDLPVMETYYQETQPNTQQGPGPPGSPAPPSVVPVPVLTVFEELESLVYGIRPSVDEAATDKLDYCQSRCLYDESCSGYMIKGSGSTPELMSPGQPCIFFSQNQPFYVYTISRTGAPFSNGFVNMSISLEKFQALQAFVGPGIPASRLTGDQDGIYVTDSLVGSKDMISGPHLDQSLLLIECQELCLENIECTGIAFPGCYLINKTTIKLLSGSSYSLMVKEKVQPVVKGAIGYSEADSYNNESRAQQSYLNRPLSCAVDSAGDFIFADNNHRIRKISGWATSCSMAGEFSIHQVQLYESSLVQADAACNNASVPALQELYVQAQQDVLENNSLDLVQQYFCNFGASNFSTQMQSFTNNVYILCTACASLSPRPPACPWQELCDCRDAMVQVATQDVHIMCPQRNAQVDPWHRWITSYTSCWMSDSDAIQWNDANKMASLQDQLQRQSL